MLYVSFWLLAALVWLGVIQVGPETSDLAHSARIRSRTLRSPVRHVLQNHTWLREYFHYHGISADLERRGFGSSRLAWAIRQL